MKSYCSGGDTVPFKQMIIQLLIFRDAGAKVFISQGGGGGGGGMQTQEGKSLRGLKVGGIKLVHVQLL